METFKVTQRKTHHFPAPWVWWAYFLGVRYHSIQFSLKIAQTATGPLTVQPLHFGDMVGPNRGNMSSRMVRNLKLVREVPTSRRNWARRSDTRVLRWWVALWSSVEKLATAMFFEAMYISVSHPYILCNSKTSARVENHSFWLMRRIFDASFSDNTELFRKVLMLILREKHGALAGWLCLFRQNRWDPRVQDSRHCCCVVSTADERGNIFEDVR